MYIRYRSILPVLLTCAALLSIGPGSAAAQAAARPPAPTLRTPDTPSLPVDGSGFIRRWLILEPIPRPGSLGDSAVQAAVKHPDFAALRDGAPRAGERVTVRDSTLTWHAVDTDRHNVNLYHFAWALSRPTSNVLFWVYSVVDVPREMEDVRLAICSNSASVWWLNGEEVIGIYNDRQSVIDDGVSPRVTLRRGPNVIRAAVINGGGATDFCARFIDEAGRPVTGITARLDSGPR